MLTLSVHHRVPTAVGCGLLSGALLAGTVPASSAVDDLGSRVVLRDGAGDVQRMDPPDTTSYPYGALSLLPT